MFEVRVPMTSANVACGFDTLGIAFQEYSIFDFELSNRLEFVNFEEEFCNEDNLVYIAFKKALNFLNKTVKGVKISLKKQAPIARGLGSSSTCVVAGIYGAYLLTGSEINKNDILKIATEIEGHPDNVAPAIFGNLCASCLVDDEAITVQYDVDERFNFMALIPDFETKTADARKALPKELPLKDAIFSLSRLGIVLRAFENYDTDTLKKVLADKIHEPYRKNLIHEYDEVKDICESIESYGFFISGSGSTLINILKDENNMEIFDIEIINNGKTEKNKLFLSEIEDEINLKIEIERTIYFSKSDNIFDSIVELRKKLESKDIYLLCNASVVNIYPSPMQKDFGGTKAYKLQMRKQATLSDVVDIFDYDSELKIGSVKEQEEFFESWIESLRK